MLENRYINEQEQFFNLAYSKGYNFDTMSNAILEKIKRVVENYYDLDDLADKGRTVPLPTARKMYIKLASEIYRGKIKNIVALVRKSHSSFSTDLKAANGFLDVDKRFIADYYAIKRELAGDEPLETPEYAKSLNVINPILC